MTATYDENLADNTSHVRFLIDDTDVSPASDALFSDEEIDAILGLETATGTALPYAAAATLLSRLRIKYAKKGGGLTEKQVSKLRLRWGLDSAADGAMKEQIRYYRARAAWLLTKKPRPLRSYNTS